MGHPAPRGVAADEAVHRHHAQSGRKDQNAPIAHILKTHHPALPIKIPRDPATKSRQRGKTICFAIKARCLVILQFSLLIKNVMFVHPDLPHLAHQNDPGGRVPGRPRNQRKSHAPNQGHLTGLIKNQRRANTDTSLTFNLQTSLLSLLPILPFLRRVV